MLRLEAVHFRHGIPVIDPDQGAAHFHIKQLLILPESLVVSGNYTIGQLGTKAEKALPLFARKLRKIIHAKHRGCTVPC